MEIPGEARNVTSDDDRGRAVQYLQALQQVLKEAPNASEITSLGEECESLITAVKAFHMEAIRFRMYNIRRQLASSDQVAPAEGMELFGNAQDALEAAGFQTK